jgi:hypothetical protein
MTEARPLRKRKAQSVHDISVQGLHVKSVYDINTQTCKQEEEKEEKEKHKKRRKDNEEKLEKTQVTENNILNIERKSEHGELVNSKFSTPFETLSLDTRHREKIHKNYISYSSDINWKLRHEQAEALQKHFGLDYEEFDCIVVATLHIRQIPLDSKDSKEPSFDYPGTPFAEWVLSSFYNELAIFPYQTSEEHESTEKDELKSPLVNTKDCIRYLLDQGLINKDEYLIKKRYLATRMFLELINNLIKRNIMMESDLMILQASGDMQYHFCSDKNIQDALKVPINLLGVLPLVQFYQRLGFTPTPNYVRIYKYGLQLWQNGKLSLSGYHKDSSESVNVDEKFENLLENKLSYYVVPMFARISRLLFCSKQLFK